jgi:hypothetical protein
MAAGLSKKLSVRHAIVKVMISTVMILAPRSSLRTAMANLPSERPWLERVWLERLWKFLERKFLETLEPFSTEALLS